MKKKGVKKGEEKRTKKITKRRESKEDVRVLCSVEAFEIFCHGRDLVSCGGLFLGGPCGEPRGLV